MKAQNCPNKAVEKDIEDLKLIKVYTEYLGLVFIYHSSLYGNPVIICLQCKRNPLLEVTKTVVIWSRKMRIEYTTPRGIRQNYLAH